VDSTTVLQRLFDLTGSLQPSALADATVLRAARVAIGQSLLSESPQLAPAAPVSTAQLIDPKLQAELESAIAEAAARQAAQPSGQRFLVNRRQLPVISSLHAVPAAQELAGMAVTQSFGPFLGPGNLQYWLDFYPIIVQATITRSPESSPFLSVPVEIPLLHPATRSLTLGAGSIWFRSQLLAGTAPAGSWTGLKIKGGSIGFSNPPSYAGGTIEISAGSTLTVKLQLDFVSSQSSGSGPGADARAAVAQLPGKVTIVFSPAGASITAASNAILTAYGITIGLSWTGTAPQYQAALRHIVVPFSSSVTSFAPQPAESDLFSMSGAATVAQVGWGLPVTVTTLATLGQAAGAGALDFLVNPGLSAQWRGANAMASLNQSWISVAAGEILVLAPGAANSRLTEEFQLWQESPPSTRQSTVDVTYLKPFSLIYITVSTAGTVQSTEIVWTSGSITAHIDRPLSADSSRLGPQMPGVVFLYETSAGAFLLVEATASAINPTPSPISLALHNALLTTTLPQRLLILGKIGAGNSVDQGALLLAFGLYSLLPTAPDPYAANFYPIGDQLSTFTAAGTFQAPPVNRAGDALPLRLPPRWSTSCPAGHWKYVCQSGSRRARSGEKACH